MTKANSIEGSPIHTALPGPHPKIHEIEERDWWWDI